MYQIKVKVVLFAIIATIIVLLAPPLLNSQMTFPMNDAWKAGHVPCAKVQQTAREVRSPQIHSGIIAILYHG